GFKSAAVKQARSDYAASIEYHKFMQFLFAEQWQRLKASANERGIEIIGDAPIYVAFDSADTWAHQGLFQLDKDGNPTNVAGVPPDYFSKTGQLWGNPLYDWKKMAKDDYAWWVARMKSTLALVDIIRLDHFRGFMGYWAVPFGAPTAEHGEWVKGPGLKFFEAIKKQLGNLPVIAEDLGEITEDVTDARLALDLPGMKIMQFAWGAAKREPLIPDPNSGFLPHQHEYGTVVYTGTHDNDTTLGWWRNTSTPDERTTMQIYLATDGNAANWDLIRACYMSVANTAVIPAQDILDLGGEARMNFPGRESGNWTWRLAEGQLNHHHSDRMRGMALMYGRSANPPEEAVPAEPKKAEY
ncbi:MAG: 4-alpha-glucanotransferase, partial [Candidatus Sumerlaeaceae bacterium]|nr:4-alpha-glucanotransferase [Candidatus Sumerlaeaceae bacterium]